MNKLRYYIYGGLGCVSFLVLLFLISNGYPSDEFTLSNMIISASGLILVGLCYVGIYGMAMIEIIDGRL